MNQALQYLLDLPEQHNDGAARGITSVCSAHPLVIEAALIEAAANNSVALIEATCNQVNQDGGYTGMQPQDFKDFVLKIAKNIGFAHDNILFGGDHLGPNPWRHLKADEAMAKAIDMTAAYAAAGFSKIYLDASMACADDENPLPAATIAERAVELAASAEVTARVHGHPLPAYIIGTEVPVPGGASEELDVLEVTTSISATETLSLHKAAFAAAGLENAFARSIGLVVQPGVEFGHANVIHFKVFDAQLLSAWRPLNLNIVFEAHSTDYQTAQALRELVAGGFAILKVGPGLTSALREAYYGLDQIAGIVCNGYEAGTLPAKMEQIMLNRPEYWQDYYEGTAAEKYVQRHYSYSDRIRYYWTDADALQAVDRLFAALDGVVIAETLISQYLPRQYADMAINGEEASAKSLVIAAVRTVLSGYSEACDFD
ncbi:MAG: D-tagatose-bisphosphate aldolase, class II, non-catalytic subunit [Alphaproteobacteria bacterium]|nr:D-tagatose-bisphosphate aldolase, class II, non-catalytic subunit [Alphaproteobacteria bacterium]